MNIIAFEVREDETEYMELAAREFGCHICCRNDILTSENVSLTAGYEAVTILGRSILTPPLLRQLKECGVSLIASRTVGYDHIDLRCARELGFKVCNSGYGPEGVADYTIMLILLSLRHYKQALWRAHVNDYSLYGLRGRELRNLTVGIIGTGRIGGAVAKELSGFGCRLLFASSRKSPELEQLGTYHELEEVCREADILTFHVPLTERTYHMVNRNTLSQMKDGVILINTARGELMDTQDLEWGIENRKIGALAMDVAEGEQGIYHEDKRCDIIKNKDMAYLRQFPNVIMTHHLAFYTEEAVRSMVMEAVRRLCRMKQGTSLL